MEEIITMVGDFIDLFKQMGKERLTGFETEPATLQDVGPTEPLLMDGNHNFRCERTAVETLCDLGFFRCDRGGEFIKLTNKAERLVEALKARQAEDADGVGLIWIVVAHCGVFIDEGVSPPNLRALMGEEWEAGDRIVITCHERQYLSVSHLPLALAGNDPLFETDVHEVAADFK